MKQLFLMAFGFFFLFLPHCSLSESPPIKIGATLALTGKLALFGKSQQEALQLAVDDLNAAGGIHGRKLQLVIEDNAGEPKMALQGVNKLLEVDKVDLFFSALSHITAAIKDRVKRENLIMIYAASVGDIAKENPRAFRDWGDIESQTRAMAETVAKAGHKKVGYMMETSEACVLGEKILDTILKELGVEMITKESYAPGETDFRPLLLRMSQKKPDAFMFCTWRDSGLVMTQIKSIGLMNMPTFHFLAPLLPASDTPEIRKLYEENKTVSLWLGFVEGELTPRQKDFFGRLKSKFGSAPRIESALAYDDLMVLAEAVKSCPMKESIDTDCVVKQIQKTDYKGVSGQLKFDEFRRSNRKDLMIQVKNGVWNNL